MSRPTPRDENSSVKRLASLLKPYRRRLGLVLLMTIVLTVLNMLLPHYFIKLLVDDVFPGEGQVGGNIHLLWIILPGILISYVLRNSLYFWSKYSTVVVGENLCFTLRNRLFENLQQMKLQFYKDNKPGKISSRVMDDSFKIQTFIQDDLPTLIQALLLFLGLVAVLFAINWQLALASTIVLPLHLLTYLKFKRPIKRASKAAQEQLENVTGNLIEKFLGAEVVKGFTGEERENREFYRATDISRRSQLESKRYHVTQKIIADMLIGLATIGLLGFGAWQVLKPTDPMKTGVFLMFFGLVGKLYPTVIELISGFAKLTRTTVSVDRVFEMLESTREDASPYQTTTIRGHLRYDSVSFCYGDGSPVLKNVCFDVQAGQVCAIVGHSGAGKSTLVSLVPRFNDPDLGFIELDGIRLDRYNLRHLRESIGIAFQECFLFNSSIMENLLYARPDASMRQVIEVAKSTGAHDIIMKFPDGYDTIMGEDGVTLSRGEKQRINLTRAMLKNPRILILDEATASIDIASESQIVPNILDFMRGKTTLMITHRPELLRHADMMVVLEEGRVTYQGPVSEAMIQKLATTPISRRRREHPDPDATNHPDHPGTPETPGRPGRAGAMLLAGLLSLLCAVGPVRAADEAAAPAKAENAVAANAGKLIPLPGTNIAEASDIVSIVAARLEVEQGFTLADAPQDMAALPKPTDLRGQRVLMKSSENEVTLLQIGFKTFSSQPPHLWLYGMSIPKGEGAATAVNPLPLVERAVEEATISLASRAASLKPTDLSVRKIHLSYIEPDRCLALLKTLGYQVIEYKQPGKSVGRMDIIEPTKQIDTQTLPVIMPMPQPDMIDLVGGAKAQGGSVSGLVMTPSIATELPNSTSAGPVMELMVLYNPSVPEQYSELLDRIRTDIDVPAQQILIEVMVLEISEGGLKSLGVKWDLQSSSHGNISSLSLGRLPAIAAPELATADIALTNIFGEFAVDIEALIRDRKAEILSRPSVLTMDNRQASIRVGEEVPVAKSVSGVSGGDTINFNFQYIPIGILLNVRPRVSSDGEEVSMQIDGIVSAEVPGEDLVLTRQNGGDTEELARAPRISTRRVQTYTRIANNTPIIIGGLVSKDVTETLRKVPFLGDLPLIGAAFRQEDADRERREVIIVITPYVLPESQNVGRTMPKDEDAFDSFGNELFRDAYRIRAEDVFDLRFLTENAQLQHMRGLAEQVARGNADLGRSYPFNRFAQGRVPGERILVYRQMYEVIKRRRIDDQINFERLIFFNADQTSESGFRVNFLEKYMQQMEAATFSATGEFIGLKDKTLALTYTLQSFNADARGILSQPVPEIQVLDCANRDEWDRLLWDMNQTDEDGKQRHTILLRSAGDIKRLKRAIVLKRTVELNVNQNQALTLDNFAIGRLLLMPAVSQDKVYLVDEEVAKYFFYTEQYYPAVRKELARDIQALQSMLRDPSITPYLDDPDRALSPLQWAPPE